MRCDAQQNSAATRQSHSSTLTTEPPEPSKAASRRFRRRLSGIGAWFLRVAEAIALALPDDWEETELRIRRRARRALAPYLTHAKRLDTLAFEILQSVKAVDATPDLYLAHISLLTRVLQDLRVTVIAAESGYTMQSWSVAASAFEAAHTMGFLAVDPSRATKWYAHKSTETSFCSAFDGAQGSFTFVGLGDSIAERDQLVRQDCKHYQSLCIAKHVNPLAEKTRYVRQREGSLRLTITPLLSERRIREAQYGLALAVRSATLAVLIFHKAHLPSEKTELFARLLALADESSRLLSIWRDVEL